MSFRKVGERRVFDGGFVRVAVATFEDVEAGERFDREIVRHGHAVAVVPLVAGGTRVVMLRQFRPAIDEVLLELPAGMIDVDGEGPEATARRELEEEAGLRAVGALEPLAEYWVAAGLMDELMTVYLSRDNEPCAARPQSAEEASMEVVAIPVDEVRGLIADGTIHDGKSIIGLLLALDRVGAGGRS